MIVSYVVGPLVHHPDKEYWCYAQGLSSYASVSKEWQALVERYTFHGLYLTRGRLEDAKRIVNHYRSRQIRTLYFEVLTLGGYEAVGLQTETQSEQLRNSITYTLDLHSLFHYLSTWDSNDVFAGGLNLALSAKSRNTIDPILNIPHQPPYGLLENTRPGMPLPQLEFVQTLMWDFQNCDQGCLLDIAWLHALPQLTTLKWELSMHGGE